VRILVSKFKSIGDVILTTALISNLRKNFPSAIIDYLLVEGCEDVIKHNHKINSVFLFTQRSSNKFKRIKNDLQIMLQLRKKKYDVYIATDRGERSALLAKFINSPISIGRETEGLNFFYQDVFNNFFSHHGDRHVTDLNNDPIRILEKKIYTNDLELFISDDMKQQFKEKFSYLNKFIHIHPVSQCNYKTLDDELMAKIIDFFEIELQVRVVLTSSGNKKEIDKMKSIMHFVKSGPINLCGQLSLLETIYLNSISRFMISVDTALSHIASSNKIPMIIFFGPTSIKRWGPFEDMDKVDSCINENLIIFSKDIKTVISSKFDCIPCQKIGCNNSGISDCLKKIDIRSLKNTFIGYKENFYD